MTDAGLNEREQRRKDMSYSPASEHETRAKQVAGVPEALGDEAAAHVVVAPGTGGPDDPGDIRTDLEDMPSPRRGGDENKGEGNA